MFPTRGTFKTILLIYYTTIWECLISNFTGTVTEVTNECKWKNFTLKKKIKLLWRAYLFVHNKTMSLMFNVYWSMKKVSAILKFLPNAHDWKVCGEFLIWQPPVINKSFIPFHKTKFNQEVLHWFPWLYNYFTWSENAYHYNLNIQPQVQ